jgi:Mrp family chromosome partitioning ATPase/capsular polysaccharide biosynthesis protein
MTHDSQLLRLEHTNSGDMTDMLQPAAGGARGMAPLVSSVQNPVARVRSIMHGRWKYAIPLAITLAATGAYLGFKSKEPKYRSHAEILFNPVQGSAQGASMMLGFQEFVGDQCIIIGSQREINLALQEQPWKTAINPKTKLPMGMGDQMASEFGDKLKVLSKGGLIQIEYIDDDKDISLRAVKATVMAYKKLYAEIDPAHTKDVLNVLEVDRNGILNNISALADQRKRICDGTIFTPDTLERYYNAKIEEYTKAETQLDEAGMRLDVVRGELKNANVTIPASLATNESSNSAAKPATDGAPTQEPSTQGATTQGATTRVAAKPESATRPAAVGAAGASVPPQPERASPEVIALHDPYMEALVNQRRNAKAALISLQDLKLPPRNPRVIEAQQAVDRIQVAIDQYMEELAGKKVLAGAPQVSSDPRLAELENLVQTFRQLQDITSRTQKQAQDLSTMVTQLHKIQEQEDDFKRRLDQVSAQIERLSNEWQLAKRADFLSEGDSDFNPYEDKRKSMAMAGGGFGALVGFAVLFLIGLLDQRVKTIADAKYTFRRSRRVLGILPTLPDNLGDPRQAAFAAHCVHHVRNLLQLSMSPDRGSVLAVTSASPGEGKTSLTLSLGLSFAAANSRTLIIDCDVVGGGLTARVNAIIRRKMGDVLKRQGRVTEQQLTLALQLANHKNMRLGEALVQLGFITPAEIDEALSVQKESLVGLLDVLDGEPLNGCITNAGSPNMFILPRGMAVASNSGQVSAKAIRRIISEARAQYDVVLIDTGPVLGSLEASIVASEADGVVLTVSRGQQKSLAERAMELLDSIGANTAGIVFNRAQTDDMDTIQYSSSIPASALQSIPQQTAGGSGTSRLGPIAFAVASATHQSTAGRHPAVNGHGAAPGGAAAPDAPAHKDQP